jgi:hypothetical protein
VDTASHQTTHVITGYLQAAEDLYANSNLNFCTTSITLCLDHTSNRSNIPPKSSYVIIVKLIAHTTEQLRLLVRSSDGPRCKRKLHEIKDLPKVHMSVRSRGVLISPEVLSVTPSCPIDTDVDLEQKILQGDSSPNLASQIMGFLPERFQDERKCDISTMPSIRNGC